MPHRVAEFTAGRRAERGKRPKVVYRLVPTDYRLYFRSYRINLRWSPWYGYRLESWCVLDGLQVLDVVYLTY